MKANQFFNKILDKWPVKVICLIIAIALYLFHQASLTEKRSFVIPLTLVEEGAVMHTGDYTSNVTVTVRANTEEISSVHSNDLTAYVSLNDIAKNGEYNLPVKVKVSDEIKGFDPFEVKVKPETIKLRAETKDLKFIPVEASIVGEPEHGYEVTDVTVEPAFVEVVGPETIIENTKKIYTQMIDVSELAKKETFQVEYRTVNKMLTVKQPAAFEVTVMIEPMEMERTIEDIEINVVSLKEGLFLQDDLEPIEVTLVGTVPVLENYTPTKRFVTLDLQKVTAPGEYDLPLVFNVPSYLELKEFSQDTVHVTVLEHQENIEQNDIGGEAQ